MKSIHQDPCKTIAETGQTSQAVRGIGLIKKKNVKKLSRILLSEIFQSKIRQLHYQNESTVLQKLNLHIQQGHLQHHQS